MRALNRTLLRQVLGATAKQLEPHLTNLEYAVGRPIDAPSFALGMLAGVLVPQHVDVVYAAGAMREEFAEFLDAVARRESRDLGPYRKGLLTSGYYHGEMHFEPGTEIRCRVVDERFVEVMFPPFDGFRVRWLEAAQVAGIE